MLLSCCRPPCFERTVYTPPGSVSFSDVARREKQEAEKTLQNMIITTIALVSVAIFLIALSRLGTGLGHLPATRMTGFSFIYHFAALHVFFIGAGVGVVAIGYCVATVCKARSNIRADDARAFAARTAAASSAAADRVNVVADESAPLVVTDEIDMRRQPTITVTSSAAAVAPVTVTVTQPALV